jgi:receptor protein-tyrosine kinase
MTGTNNGGPTMQLRDYLSTIRRRRWLVVFAVVATAGAAFVFSSRKAPAYEARARIFIGPRAAVSNDIGAALEELTFSREFIASYAELLKSRPLAQRVVILEGLPYDASELASRVTTKVIADTRIIEVSVVDGQGGLARRIANTLVETFVREGVDELGGAGGVRASVLEPALLPQRPVSPKPVRDAVLGALLGLTIGGGAAFLRDHLDDTLRSREQVEAALAPLPVLAALPRIRRSRKRRLVFDRNPRSPAAEAFRTLRTSIQLSAIDAPVPRVLVTSPSAGDGKTLVAANLAASLAMGGARTVLVGTDLRRPVAHHYLGATRSPGISEVVAGGEEIGQVLQQTPIANLLFLPPGNSCPNPSELLGSQRMADALGEVSSRAEIMVLDAPPALAVTDSALLASHADGVLLVLRAGRTQLRWALETKAIFERVGVPVLGVVLNEVDQNDLYYYYRSYQRTYARNVRRGRHVTEKVFCDDFRPARGRRLPAERAGSVHTVPSSTNGSEQAPPQYIDLAAQELPSSPERPPAE